MSGRVDGKVVIITGAAHGIGLASVKLFAQEGATVVATNLNKEALEQSVQPLLKDGLNVVCEKLDVSNIEDWKQVTKFAFDNFGHIDILVNNAGYHASKNLLETTENDWDRTMNINAKGVFFGMQTMIPFMMKNNDGKGKGSIINTSSEAGLDGGSSDANSVAYSASKGAVDAMTRHAAQWYGKYNIRVNSVNPGPIFTEMAKKATGAATQAEMGEQTKSIINLVPHAGEPNDIAYGYLYLASDESKFVTGTNLIIDGGWHTNAGILA